MASVVSCTTTLPTSAVGVGYLCGTPRLARSTGLSFHGKYHAVPAERSGRSTALCGVDVKVHRDMPWTEMTSCYQCARCAAMVRTRANASPHVEAPLPVVAPVWAAEPVPRIPWFTGLPPVTGYYWLKSWCVTKNKQPAYLAKVAILPHTKNQGRPYAWTYDGGGGWLGNMADHQWQTDERDARLHHPTGGGWLGNLADHQWAGPLPVVEVEEWMGLPTTAGLPPG